MGTTAAAATAGDLLFVYGTLQTVAQHPMGQMLRQHADLIGAGSIRARLYIIDDPDEPGQNFYPGALPSADPGDRVHGEIYRLTNAAPLLAELDRFEACSPDWPEPHEFLKRLMPVSMADGAEVLAWCYMYTWDVSGAERAASGRFLDVASAVR